MQKVLSLALVASLSACAGGAHLDYCKGADVRRAGWRLIANTPAALTAAGQPVPPAATLAAIGAQNALALLDARCPPGGAR